MIQTELKKRINLQLHHVSRSIRPTNRAQSCAVCLRAGFTAHAPRVAARQTCVHTGCAVRTLLSLQSNNLRRARAVTSQPALNQDATHDTSGVSQTCLMQCTVVHLRDFPSLFLLQTFLLQGPSLLPSSCFRSCSSQGPTLFCRRLLLQFSPV